MDDRGIIIASAGMIIAISCALTIYIFSVLYPVSFYALMQKYGQSAIIGDSWAFRSAVAEQTGIIIQTPSQFMLLFRKRVS
ncbi:hypothetical protein [Microcystis aeruginosa]